VTPQRSVFRSLWRGTNRPRAGFVSNIDVYWEEPLFARWLRKLAAFARVITFDKRGTGLSDRVEQLPTMDKRMDAR